MPLNRRSFLGLSTILLTSPLPVFSSEKKSAKRILVYGDSNSFGWAWSPEKDIYRLPIDRIWPQVMAQKLGPDYEVEVNALGGRTVKRDQKDGNGTDKSLSGKLFNGMVSLPAVLSENLPLDLVIIMLGTNDANSRYKNNPKAIADDLEEMIRKIQAGFRRGGRRKGQRNLCALIVERILGGMNETSERCRRNLSLFTYVRKHHGPKHSDQSRRQSLYGRVEQQRCRQRLCCKASAETQI